MIHSSNPVIEEMNSVARKLEKIRKNNIKKFSWLIVGISSAFIFGLGFTLGLILNK